MATKAEIFNLALTNVYAKARVASPTEDTDEAQACLANFDNSLAVLLEDHDWNFASAYEDLALLKDTTSNTTGNPQSPWLFQYSYPSDCVKAREIVRATKNEKEIAFRVDINDNNDGKIIHTDKATARLRYTRLINKESLLPPKAVHALSWQLAIRIAMTLTGSAEIKELAERGYAQTLFAAKSSNYNENVDREAPDPRLIQAR